MKFTDVNLIAETLAAFLNTLADGQAQSLLKTVKVIHGANGYTKIFEALQDLTDFPAAVVSIEKIEYPADYGGAARKVECGITLIERPYGLSGQAETAKDHLEELLDALTGSVPGQALRINDIPFVTECAEQLEYEPEYQVWNVTVTAMQ